MRLLRFLNLRGRAAETNTQPQQAEPNRPKEILLRDTDDTFTRAMNALLFAGFANPNRLGLVVHVAYILEQYAKIDRAAQEGG